MTAGRSINSIGRNASMRQRPNQNKMDRAWIDCVSDACRRLTASNASYQNVFGEIYGSAGYYRGLALFHDPNTRDEAFKLLDMMIKDVQHGPRKKNQCEKT